MTPLPNNMSTSVVTDRYEKVWCYNSCMDKYTVSLTLKRFYAVENRSTKLGTIEEYIQRHMDNIIKESGGEWDDAVAEKYLNNLEQSL